MQKPFIIFFKDLTIKDVPVVGGKNASLGEMYSRLTSKGINVPNGFATTADAYFYFLEQAGIKTEIKKILQGLNTHNILDLAKRGRTVRQTILGAKLPPELEREITQAYQKLSKEYAPSLLRRGEGGGLDVAVRSSATAEDLPDASFAGQQETFLNVRGEVDLLIAVKKCVASLFTNRAISYRQDKGFDHFTIGLSVGVQKMVRSDLGASGVTFTIDTESGFKDIVLINSIYGLGENIVQGKVNPDEFYYFKPTGAIISKTIGHKDIKMVYSNDHQRPTKDIKVSLADQHRQSISDSEIKRLAEWAVMIEKHYGRPMDIEWAKDGRNNKLYIIQARPETVQSQRDYNIIEEYILAQRGKILARGRSVGSRIGAGIARVILDIKGISQFKPGEVLVTDMTDPDWEPIMKIASAIVTDRGGRTCHAAIVSRELGIPCVVGTKTVTSAVTTGQGITVSCAEGEEGFVYEGELKFNIKKTNIADLFKGGRPKTKIMLNIGAPDIAFASSFIPNDGVGLAREEFIVANYIKIHPRVLLNYEELKKQKKLTAAQIREIAKITVGYADKKKFYVDKLSQGVGIIAAAFYPKDVILRLSDFKTDEYKTLLGGERFEPEEDNPLLGWRGASRYYHPEFIEVFKMECAALRLARDEMGLTNVKIMIPFVRTVEEIKKVIAIMAQQGLKRGRNGLELYMMTEVPSSVILADEFAKYVDGFSIGSNDLTMATLGVDRNSERIAALYDERDEAVKRLISQAIKSARQTKTKIGICGQGPSDYPDFAQFLVEQGIDSISLNPDTVIKTTVAILKTEKRLRN
ncbi:phosphoenolpyruvate synthase [Candidatus Falkowbacteria bacterium CG10_big_fil_rev_8_21_14_0_10_44_15]|uniref:Phosphoenolpyruvate synthase n=1 Tax=Candidatus Falkowbacteria bacterium CG10_big_fil_rev_8_21_14_0_10_44_15 TaxID=1974569 RepID=A0A2H0UZG8_9BACT|nr:MAG: phosphoenolpyruvate synthase [Candidatus Falkowbacteria bacterium CG10_big_fil_rev_8_21_14_0_10_44_15]